MTSEHHARALRSMRQIVLWERTSDCDPIRLTQDGEQASAGGGPHSVVSDIKDEREAGSAPPSEFLDSTLQCNHTCLWRPFCFFGANSTL